MGKRGNSRRRSALKRRLSTHERDCWLCWYPLDFDLDWRDPLAVEIDEETPASKGGDIYGRRTPCHLVHRCCNIEKGDRILPSGALRGWFEENVLGARPRPETSRRW